jgi:hypothetical protein
LSVSELADVEALLIWVVEVRKVGGVGDSLAWAARLPPTLLSLRAMNPRNLNAHVERAIAQSGNENISGIKVLSSNQLRSGDLSIKTATSNETEALTSLPVWRETPCAENHQ